MIHRAEGGARRRYRRPPLQPVPTEISTRFARCEAMPPSIAPAMSRARLIRHAGRPMLAASARKSGSHQTRQWRGTDSNAWSRGRGRASSSVSVPVPADYCSLREVRQRRHDAILRPRSYHARPRVRIPLRSGGECEPDFQCREDNSAGPSSMGAAEAVSTCLVTRSLSLRAVFGSLRIHHQQDP